MPRASIDEVYQQIASDLKMRLNCCRTVFIGWIANGGHATKYAAEALMARILFYTDAMPKPNYGRNHQSTSYKWIDDCVYHLGHDLVSDQRNLWAYTNKASNDNDTEEYKYRYVLNNNLEWVGLGSIETLFANKHKLKGNNWTYTWFSNTVSQFYSPWQDNPKQKMEKVILLKVGEQRACFACNGRRLGSLVCKQSYLNGATGDPRLQVQLVVPSI